MSKTKRRSINSKSKEQSIHNLLNIDTFRAIAIAIGLTIAIYVICFVIGDSYLKSLLYERGFTQYIVVLMASSIAVFTVLKYLKIGLERKQLNKNFIDENVNFDNHQAYELVNLQRSLSQGKSFITVGLSKIVSAYINSGNRSTVPLVAVERMESQLLLAVDIYLPDLPDYIHIISCSFWLKKCL